MMEPQIEEDEMIPAPNVAFLTPGKTVKMLRELQGISQNELARRCDLEQSNISAIENERSELGKDRAILIASALNVDPAVILLEPSNFRPEYRSFLRSLISRRQRLSLSNTEPVVYHDAYGPDIVNAAALEAGIDPRDVFNIVKYVFEPRSIGHNGANDYVSINYDIAFRHLS